MSVTVHGLISTQVNEWGGANKLTQTTLVDSGVYKPNRQAYALRAISVWRLIPALGRSLVTLLTLRKLWGNLIPYKYLYYT